LNYPENTGNQVRYESHLSDKARCSEASQFSVTEIWYLLLKCFQSLPDIVWTFLSASQQWFLSQQWRKGGRFRTSVCFTVW